MILKYNFYKGEDDTYPDEFEYEVGYDRVEEALINILSKDIQNELKVKEYTDKVAKYIVDDLNLVDEMAERYDEQLNDYFERDAYELYRNRD